MQCSTTPHRLLPFFFVFCFLSPLVVSPPYHPWLSPLLVALTGERETGKILSRPGSCVDRGARGAQSQSLKVSQSPGRPGSFEPVSGGPVNRYRSLTIEPRPTPFGAQAGYPAQYCFAGSHPAAPVRGVRRRQAGRTRPGAAVFPKGCRVCTPPKTVNFCQLL
jgi:hypothetical protein